MTGADPAGTEPDVRLVETSGETTLYIADGQAIQGWERELMWAAADLLCAHGSEFLEVGLGLGYSALRIAQAPGTRRHTVIEKYPAVIDLFRARHAVLPPTLEIVCADFFDYVERLEPRSLDGIFFDPYFGRATGWQDPELWARVRPLLVGALRPGGVLVPYFATRPVLQWPFYEWFDRVIVHRRAFSAYPTTDYTSAVQGDAFLQCFFNS